MATLDEIAEELGKDLERLQYAGKTVTVKYKVGLCHTFRADSSYTHTSVSSGLYSVIDLRQDPSAIREKIHLDSGRDPACEYNTRPC